MGNKTQIEWTQATWNPVTGCTKVSEGCRNCYAQRMSKRLQAMGQANYRDGFQVRIHEHMLSRPLQWKKPQTVFVNSMSDLFHCQVPEEFIHRVFDVMATARHHIFQVLTKRSERLLELADELPWPDNVWMGVSVENLSVAERIERLRRIPAAVKFLSLEPLLGPLPELDLRGIDWVIVGGESGPGARAMSSEWVLGIRDQCVRTGVPFFFKQWGGTRKKKNGNELQGRTWQELPRCEHSVLPVSG